MKQETTQQNLFDITKRRHLGNKESVAANERIAPHKSDQREKVLLYINLCESLDRKTYSKEIAKRLNIKLHAVSARISELKRENRIVPTGERIEGCAVLRPARIGETNEVKRSVCKECERLKKEIETLKANLKNDRNLVDVYFE